MKYLLPAPQKKKKKIIKSLQTNVKKKIIIMQLVPLQQLNN